MQAFRRRTIAALGAAALCVPIAATAGAPAIAGTHGTSHRATHRAATSARSGRITFATTKPAWATAARATTALRNGQRLSFRVQLRLRHQGQAERAAVAASTPGSRTYGHYLKAEQFQRQYGASDRTVQRLSAYFRGQGMRVTGGDWHALAVTATVGAVERTFRTSLSLYRVDGHSLRAVDRAMSLPRSVGRSVATISGVNQSATVRQPMHISESTPAATTSAITPPVCSQYWDQNEYTLPQAYGRTSFPTRICGYSPAQMRSAYGISGLVSSGQNGAGTKVAIIDAYGSPTILKDANTFATSHGDPRFAKDQYQQKLFKPFVKQDACGGEEGWNGEQTLDVESLHAMAPGANVLYVGGSDCITGIDSAQQWVVDNATTPGSKAYGVSMVSNSYGFPGDEPTVIVDPAEQAVNHQTLIQAANEGIGYYFSSGDEGDNTIDGYSSRPQASYESSDPFATGVGGTSLAVDANGDYEFETGWGTDLAQVTADGTGYVQAPPGVFRYGGGGGVSTQFAQPSYQAGTVPDSLSQLFGTAKMRVAPDVAMDGDPWTGFPVGQTDLTTGVYSEATYGGTSLATPLFVGLQAVTQGSGAHIGFANPLLYGLKAKAFHDVQPPASPVAVAGLRSDGNLYLVTFDHDSSLFTAPGYDDVTGRGTPNGTAFVTTERNGLGSAS